MSCVQQSDGRFQVRCHLGLSSRCCELRRPHMRRLAQAVLSHVMRRGATKAPRGWVETEIPIGGFVRCVLWCTAGGGAQRTHAPSAEVPTPRGCVGADCETLPSGMPV